MDHSFIYCISTTQHDNGPCKIGISVDPDRRLKQLQTAYPQTLSVRYREMFPVEIVRLYERIIHRDIGYTRSKGEWFNVSVEQAIAQIQFTIIHYGDVDDLASKLRKGWI